MESSPEVNGRLEAECHPRVRAAALCTVLATLLIVSAGCGTKGADRNEAAVTPASSPPVSDAGVQKSGRTGAALGEARSSGATNRVVLTEKGCIEFEPQWVTVQVGQSVTWHSDLKSPVTIHVSQGGFDRSVFVVRPGANASSGPAMGTGAFSVWTEPAACQGSPRGVRGSGPGIMVEGDVSSR